MYPRIKSVQHMADYQLQIEFTSGEQGTVDLRGHVVGCGGVFSPFEDVDFFRQVKVDAESGTLVWPNGVE